MARVSSASTESDNCNVPAMVAFSWEDAPGRPAIQTPSNSEFNGNPAAAERGVIQMPSLPLPPGKRPKDGFYLPFSRPAQSPNFQIEAQVETGGSESSQKERKSFNLKFPGSMQKHFFRSRVPRKTHKLDVGWSDDTDHAGGGFNHVSSHRLASRVKGRFLVKSCFGLCVTAVEGKSSRDGQRRKSSTQRHATQFQVPSSRLMASMLMSLVPSESDDAESVAFGNGITDEDCDEISNSKEHGTAPRARVSSREFFFDIPEKVSESFEIVLDPGSPTVRSHEELTRPARTLAHAVCTQASPEKEFHLQRNHTRGRGNNSLQLETQLPSRIFDWQGTSSQSATPVMVDDFSPSRSSCADTEYSFSGSCRVAKPKRREPIQPPATSPSSKLPQDFLPKAQLQTTRLQAIRINDTKPVVSTPNPWLQALKSSPLWPNSAPKPSTRATGDDSDQDSWVFSSSDSSDSETPEPVSQTPSLISPVLCNFNLSPKPATWAVSEKLLQSSSMVHHKLQRQQSHQSPRSSFMDDASEPVQASRITLPGSSSSAEQSNTTTRRQCRVDPLDHDSAGADVAVPADARPASRVSEASNSNSGLVIEEAKAGVLRSSGKALPIYVNRSTSVTIACSPVSTDLQ